MGDTEDVLVALNIPISLNSHLTNIPIPHIRIVEKRRCCFKFLGFSLTMDSTVYSLYGINMNTFNNNFS
jgi:hypothetical protein